MTRGSSMLAMILNLPPQRAQPSLSMLNTRLSRRALFIATCRGVAGLAGSTGGCFAVLLPRCAGGAVRVAFQSLQPGRHGLQREQLLPRPRTHGDAVRDGMPDQVIQRAGLCSGDQPGPLDGALDVATTFQHLAHLCRDLLDQLLQVVRVGGCHMAEHWRLGTISQIAAMTESVTQGARMKAFREQLGSEDAPLTGEALRSFIERSWPTYQAMTRQIGITAE